MYDRREITKRAVAQAYADLGSWAEVQRVLGCSRSRVVRLRAGDADLTADELIGLAYRLGWELRQLTEGAAVWHQGAGLQGEVLPWPDRYRVVSYTGTGGARVWSVVRETAQGETFDLDTRGDGVESAAELVEWVEELIRDLSLSANQASELLTSLADALGVL